MEALNILWQIVPKSQGTIGILRVIAEGGLRHHRRLEIEVEVEGARANIEDEEAQCQRYIEDRPMPSAPARAYAMKACGDQDAPKVIAGIISLYGIEMNALIEPKSTHSYVCIEHVFDKMIAVEQLSYDMHVTSPLGHSVNVNRVYKNCPIIIHDSEFYAGLIDLPFCEFDLILGMDWLSNHRAIIDCDKKTKVLRCSDQSEVIVHGVGLAQCPM